MQMNNTGSFRFPVTFEYPSTGVTRVTWIPGPATITSISSTSSLTRSCLGTPVLPRSLIQLPSHTHNIFLSNCLWELATFAP
eukprot:501613-Rhodomonas_salina.1